MQGERNSRKSKQRNKCRKNNNRFMKLKIKIQKGEKGKVKLHRTAEVHREAEVYNNSKKCD